MSISSLIGGLFGGKDAEKAARLQAQGAEEARSASEGYYQQGINYLSPYITGGQSASNLLNDVLGLNGPEAQARALSTYQASPSYNILQDVLGNVSRQTAGQFAGGGLYRSGAMAEELSRRLADMRLGDFQNWLGLAQGQGAQGLSAVGTGAGLAGQRGRDVADLIQNKYGHLGEAQVARSRVGNDLLGGLISGVGQGIGSAIGKSDIRLKRDIKRIGSLSSGLPIYAFRFIGDDTPRSGVMAHEAREMFPEAVMEDADGYLMVNYAQIF